MMGTQPLPPHQQPGGGGPLGLKKQQEFLGNMSSSIYQIIFTNVLRMKREENLNEYLFSITAAQANASVNATSSQNIGHVVDGEEIETKHQPGQMIPQQQHGTLGSHGTLGQQPHPLHAHQQVRNDLIQKIFIWLFCRLNEISYTSV